MSFCVHYNDHFTIFTFMWATRGLNHTIVCNVSAKLTCGMHPVFRWSWSTAYYDSPEVRETFISSKHLLYILI